MSNLLSSTFLSLPRYHRRVLLLYLVLAPLLVFWFHSTLDFVADFNSLTLILGTSVLIGGWYIWHISKTTWYLYVSSFVYGLAFALPEEILFRGIIQGQLETILSSPLLAVFSAAGIYGLAHLGNGARGWHPTCWHWKLGLVTTVAGIFFGLVFLITHSLFFPILFHLVVLMYIRLQELH